MSERFVLLRRAVMDDAARVLEWRNDPAVRSSFFNTDAVERDSHFRWFEATLNDPARHLLVGETRDGEPIGVVRFDELEAGVAEISIYVIAPLQGLGWGTALLRAAQVWIQQHTGIRTIRARVLESNSRSFATFAKSGFVVTSRVLEWTVRAC